MSRHPRLLPGECKQERFYSEEESACCWLEHGQEVMEQVDKVDTLGMVNQQNSLVEQILSFLT